MKRTISRIVSAILLLMIIVTLSACGTKSSEGLEFKSNGDGTCSWKGLGTCIDTEIIVPETYEGEKVVSVESFVLGSKDGVTKIVLPEGIIELDNLAFSGCATLKSVKLPATLKTLGWSTFEDASLSELDFAGEWDSFDFLVDLDENEQDFLNVSLEIHSDGSGKSQIPEASMNSLICIACNVTSLKYNGKNIAMSGDELNGDFNNESNLYAFKFSEGKVTILSGIGDKEEIGTFDLTYNEDTMHYLASGTTKDNDKIELVFINISDAVFVGGRINGNSNLSGCWVKE